jgi:predicted DNA-binding protein (MmcQ/YjbR family)
MIYLTIYLYSDYLYSMIKIQLIKKHWNTVLLDGTIPDQEVFHG